MAFMMLCFIRLHSMATMETFAGGATSWPIILGKQGTKEENGQRQRIGQAPNKNMDLIGVCYYHITNGMQWGYLGCILAWARTSASQHHHIMRLYGCGI
jgi:hypothetical protein